MGLTGRDTLHASAACEAADGGLGDALDVVTQDLAMALGAAFAEALATFSAWKDGLLAFLCSMKIDAIEKKACLER